MHLEMEDPLHPLQQHKKSNKHQKERKKKRGKQDNMKVCSLKKQDFTKEINDKTAITVSPRWFVEETLAIWWVKAFNPRRDEPTGVRI